MTLRRSPSPSAPTTRQLRPVGIRLVGNDEPLDDRWERDEHGNLRDESGLIVCVAIDDCEPEAMSDEACRAVARVLDDIRAARARRQAGGAHDVA